MHRLSQTAATTLVLALLVGGTHAATIPQAATQAGEFNNLLKATRTAGLSDYVAGRGPFTMFAPNDAAFTKIPKAQLDALMLPANRTKLKVTLGNHLVTGLLPIAAIERGLAQADAVSVTAINTMPLTIRRDGAGLTVNGAHIVGMPMKVDNGIIYVVDTVLMPAMPLQPTY